MVAATNHPTRTAWTLTSETVVNERLTSTVVSEARRCGAHVYEIVTFRGGRTEIYQHEDGIAMFRGYYEDISATPLAAAVQPHVVDHLRRHRQGWQQMGYLPGAEGWLAA